MELTIKGNELQELIGKLNQVANKPVRQITERQFKLAYRLKKIMDHLISAYKDLDKKRVHLVEKMGVEDKKVQQFQVPPEKLDEFNKLLEAIRSEPINIEYESIPLEILTNSGIDITLMELAFIEQFIEKSKEA